MTDTTTAERWLGWHWIRDDGYWGQQPGLPEGGVRAGQTYSCQGPLVLCQNGLHASRRALDGLQYAPGARVCRVELLGERIDGTAEHADKSVARQRRVLWVADATQTLHEFAVWCAEGALTREREAGREPDPRSWAALAVKRRWLDGRDTDAELTAASTAAWDAARYAAWDAARYAAWDAARYAAWDAAWYAARYAAWDAAWYAAWDAAWAEQNAELERRLLALAPEETEKEGPS